MRPLLPRLPMEPLSAECRRQGTTIHLLGQVIGLQGHQHSMRRDGLTWGLADRLAVAMGTHPALIWGDDWWAVARAYDEHVPERRQAQLDHDRMRRRAKSEAADWSEVEQSWQSWRLCRDRIELHRAEWPTTTNDEAA